MPHAVIVELLPKTVLGRVLAALAAIAVVIIALFFITVALAVAAVALVIAIVRVMWLARKARRTQPRADEPIEVEYSVVSERELPERRRDQP